MLLVQTLHLAIYDLNYCSSCRTDLNLKKFYYKFRLNGQIGKILKQKTPKKKKFSAFLSSSVFIAQRGTRFLNQKPFFTNFESFCFFFKINVESKT